MTQTSEFLIAFADLRAFLRVSQQLGSSGAVFGFLDRFAHVIHDAVSPTSGRVIKYIGDAALIVFPGEDADLGVRTLLEMKDAVDAFLAAEGVDSRLSVAAHYGEATMGPFGPEQRMDIVGEAVNRAAMTERGNRQSDFAITPDVFGRLQPATQERFCEHAPPSVYLVR